MQSYNSSEMSVTQADLTPSKRPAPEIPDRPSKRATHKRKVQDPNEPVSGFWVCHEEDKAVVCFESFADMKRQ